MEEIILAGDIGGTKTVFGIFSKGKNRPVLEISEVFSSRDAPYFEILLDQFLSKHKIPIKRACFGIAGPIYKRRCKATNLPWEVSVEKLEGRYGWSEIFLINDLIAASYAVPFLHEDELFLLKTGEKILEKPIGLVSPGTGLGMSLIIPVENNYLPIASEGGHSDFAPKNKDELRLWQYLHERFLHVSIERLLSGPGLFSIYNWLKSENPEKEPEWIARKLKEEDPGKVITTLALEEKGPLCSLALDMFISIFGSVAGNLALIGLTLGGIYLGGGISPKILPKLKTTDLFLKGFTEKGKFKDILFKIPVYVILNDKSALLGAAICAGGMDKIS